MQNSSLYKRLDSGLPEIRGMGLMAFDPIWAQTMHESNVCELLWVQRGRLELCTEKKKYCFREGQFVLIAPKTMHRDAFDIERGLEVYMVFFVWPQARQLCRNVSLDALTGLHLAAAGDTMQTFHQLRTRPVVHEATDTLVLRSFLLSFLMSLSADVHRMSQAQEDAALADQRRKRLMKAACDYLGENYHRCVSLDEIAEALDISSYYLSHVFSEEAGFSLFSYLTNLRLRKACELLEKGSKNVSEVAFAVGYENANYFGKVFRKHFGCSPGKYFKVTDI